MHLALEKNERFPFPYSDSETHISAAAGRSLPCTLDSHWAGLMVLVSPPSHTGLLHLLQPCRHCRRPGTHWQSRRPGTSPPRLPCIAAMLGGHLHSSSHAGHRHGRPRRCPVLRKHPSMVSSRDHLAEERDASPQRGKQTHQEQEGQRGPQGHPHCSCPLLHGSRTRNLEFERNRSAPAQAKGNPLGWQRRRPPGPQPWQGRTPTLPRSPP